MKGLIVLIENCSSLFLQVLRARHCLVEIGGRPETATRFRINSLLLFSIWRPHPREIQPVKASLSTSSTQRGIFIRWSDEQSSNACDDIRRTLKLGIKTDKRYRQLWKADWLIVVVVSGSEK